MLAKKRLSAVSIVLVCALAALAALAGLSLPVSASASDIKYCSDGSYEGEGGFIDADEYVYWDSYVEDNEYYVFQAPSYGVTDLSIDNYCAPATGTNVIGYYDRYYPNLIPNFEPGMMNGDDYWYFPDMRFAPVVQVFEDLYDLMHTNEGSIGTSGNDFKNGLKEYVQDRGYSLNYGSFYQNSTNVNLTTLQNMVNSNKVGVLLCSTYNYIYAINNREGYTFISKVESSRAHMMMVYGYYTVDYYKDGEVFRTDTYLQVSSGYSSGDQGYVLMGDDSLTIQEALIVNIS